MSIFLSPGRLLHGNIKTFDLIFKKMEESIRVVGLVLEGQSSFTSGQKYNFKTYVTKA